VHCREKSRRITYIFIIPAIIGLAACSIPELSPWSKDFTPPETLETERMLIEPLQPEHVELNYAAIMGSRFHLLHTLHWEDWPREDFSIAEHYQDVKNYWKLFQERSSYTYAVLSPDQKNFLGCIYMNQAGENGMSLSFWVIEEEVVTGLDRHLLHRVFDWIEQEWPFETVHVTHHTDNRRGIRITEGLGLALDENASDENNEVFVWHRPPSKKSSA
jgi:RimJ/RimL family protein N-acetyltransferase